MVDLQAIGRWAQDVKPDVVRWRRHLHAHPELSFAEVETARYIRRHLDALSIPWTNPAGHSTVAVIQGARPGVTVALRADIDALPIAEENDVPYKSTRPGVMHACGHDAHTAILMAVARWFAEHRDFAGTVKLLFQEAEEQPPGGAKALVAAGVLDDVDHVLGLHVWSDVPTGHAWIVSGPMMAATDRFTARIMGKGGHAAAPHQAIDAVLVAAHFIMNLQTVVSRKVDPLQPAVVSVGSVESGSASNVLASHAEVKGTMRSFDPAVREQLWAEVERTLAATCSLYGAEYEMQVNEGYPVLVNHPRETDVFRKVCRDVLGEDNGLDKSRPTLAGEDFAYYVEQRPGAFLFLGCRNEEKGAIWPHHNPRFTIDEDVLPLGVEILVRAALELLGAGARAG